MSSAFAASITVLPGATSTFLPSISRFSIGWNSHVRWHETLLVVDMVLEFGAEVADKALHRQRGGIAQRANRAPGDVIGHGQQEIEVLVPAFTTLYPVHDAPQPARAFAARRA